MHVGLFLPGAYGQAYDGGAGKGFGRSRGTGFSKSFVARFAPSAAPLGILLEALVSGKTFGREPFFEPLRPSEPGLGRGGGDGGSSASSVSAWAASPSAGESGGGAILGLRAQLFVA
jgi:hypothetical protein